MYRCSWITSALQCNNTTDNLVCSECEEEKSRLYHEYKEAEKTVISAINDASPRGDLLEASKVIGRITRVVKLRRKFTSRLAPQSRDIGHEYYVSKLLEKLSQYHNYISSMLIDIYTDTDQEEHTSAIIQCSDNQKQIVASIRDVVESDPFIEFDDAVKTYQRNDRIYQEQISELERLLGCTGDDFMFIAMFIWGFVDTLTQIRYRLMHLAKGHSIVNVHCHNKNGINLYEADHEQGTEYVTTVRDVLPQIDKNLIQWISQNRTSHIMVKARVMLLDNKKQVVVMVTSGAKVYNRAYIWNVRVNGTGGYNWIIVGTDINEYIKSSMLEKLPIIRI